MQLSKIELPKWKWLSVSLDAGFLLLLCIVAIAILALPYPLQSQVELTAGEVAQQDIVAPRRITYDSPVQTQKARERAAQNVPDYYDPPISRLRRQQVRRASEVLDFITTVRSDTLSPDGDRVEYLLAIADLELTPEMAERLLNLSDSEWQTIQTEVPEILNLVMREDIKENALAAARRRVPVLISPELDDSVAAVVAELVQPLVRPNSFFNPDRTEALRQQSQEQVPIQTNTLEQGEVIIRAGDIVTEEDVEALEQMGLSQGAWSWWSLAESALIILLLGAILGGTLYRIRPDLLESRREVWLFLLLCSVGLILAKLMVIPHDWMPLLYPLAAFSMLAAIMIDMRLAVALVLCLNLVVVYLSNGNVTLIFYNAAGALLGALVLGKAERLTSFLWAGSTVIVVNLLVLLTFWSQPIDGISSSRALQAILLAVLNGGLAAAVALIGYFVLGNLFRLTTNLQLMELSRPTHPLLRQLLLKAPGTYHHTILVSNMAERAAEAIGADAFLTRVGAYYHDIGKTSRPYFFAENISDGDSSPHQGLDPLTSAQIIISHVKDGADLARKYGLPPAIQAFIWQHHGAQLMKYFYRAATENVDEGEVVDEQAFRYPGPDPLTKESAITMLADTCEAAVRAERPATRGELSKLVDQLITQRVLEGALDRCDLTFKELQTIRGIFVQVLQGVHHPRIKYPDAVDEKAITATTLPDTATEGAEVSAPMGERGAKERLTSNGRNGVTSSPPVTEEKAPDQKVGDEEQRE